MTTAQAAPERPADLRADQRDITAVRQAGAEAADLVIRMQLDAGMSADRIEESANRVLAGRFHEPTPAGDAFYGAYDEAAATCVAELREPDRDIEAG